MSLHRRAKPLIRGGVSAIMGLIAVAGCSGSSETPPTQCDVPALFEQRCGGSATGCHEGSPSAANLDLVTPGVEDRVANVAGNSCSGVLANPADPEGSLLYEKVAATTPSCGARMPLGQAPLTQEEITCVRDWISGLLPPQPDPPDTPEDCPECECIPNEVDGDCYSGPLATKNVGACQSGTRTCSPSGLQWGPCMDEVLPTGENCFTEAIDENCDGVMLPCSDNWSTGAAAADAQNTRSATIDSQGNVVVLGDFVGTVSFGGDALVATGTKHDVLLAKYDRYGNHIFSKRFGDSSNQYASQVVVDAQDNIIILGRAYGTINFGGVVLDAVGTEDVFVAKFDPDGKHVWSRIFGGTDIDRSERIAVDGAGDVVLTGGFNAQVDFGGGRFTSAGLRDAFVLKLRGTNGGHVFSLQFGGTADDAGFGVGIDAENDIFITGRFQDAITVGTTTLTSMGGTDIYVARLSSNGAVEWATSWGGVGEDAPFDLAVHAGSGEFAITGYASDVIDLGGGPLTSAGSRDLFVARYAGNGAPLFSQLYGDAMDQAETDYDTNSWNSLAIDAQGNMYLAGYLSYTASFGGPLLSSAGKNDVFFVKLAPNGEYVVGNRFGGTGTEIGLDVAVGANGQIVLVGRMFGTQINFGISGTVAGIGTGGGGDAFVAQLVL